MNRREFINWMGVGALATSLPLAIAACQADTSEAPADTSTETGDDATAEASPSDAEFALLGTVTDLNEAGSLSGAVQGKTVVVTRDPDNPDSLVAVDSVCTHAGCDVAWDGTVFACPCHASNFALDGSVAAGPASEPLPIYEAKIEGDQVLVKV